MASDFPSRSFDRTLDEPDSFGPDPDRENEMAMERFLSGCYFGGEDCRAEPLTVVAVQGLGRIAVCAEHQHDCLEVCGDCDAPCESTTLVRERFGANRQCPACADLIREGLR